ncbi:hypothetical protein BO71DRAFT_197174 [Aspergillus ellipticus CBS 707.79]|uniref:Uncharacterized protein n=1 Tax=Aspergillus ellipticus CBS 707.79 TaxID=1448320 RepID=A0A319DEP3_9EURO|nr:hypothetical protein BO71DRAFT_197174 [Aspergillus ellipticus CBS 707.79]
MAATLTCHGHALHAPYTISTGDDRPPPTVSPVLPLSPEPEQVSSCLITKVPSLNIASQLVSPGVNDDSDTTVYTTTLEVTEITETTLGAATSPTVSDQPPSNASSDEMDSGLEASKNTSPSSSPSHDRRISKRKRTTSPPSPSSKTSEQLRSSSRNPRRPALSRHSSLQSHHRTATTASFTPLSDQTARREDLIALHRESCRLFQDDGLSSPSPRISRPASSNSPRTPSRPLRSPSSISSPSGPRPQLSISTYRDPGSRDDYPRPPLRASTFSAVDSACDSPTYPTVTVIDWTSPSTRRREYEKIDRASSGVRGFWRRVAPRWCQFGDNRTPFFEEGKDGKGNHEGSVRRFRMDIPEEPGCETQASATLPRGFKLTKSVVHRMGNRRLKTP